MPDAPTATNPAFASAAAIAIAIGPLLLRPGGGALLFPPRPRPLRWLRHLPGAAPEGLYARSDGSALLAPWLPIAASGILPPGRLHKPGMPVLAGLGLWLGRIPADPQAFVQRVAARLWILASPGFTPDHLLAMLPRRGLAGWQRDWLALAGADPDRLRPLSQPLAAEDLLLPAPLWSPDLGPHPCLGPSIAPVAAEMGRRHPDLEPALRGLPIP